MNKVFCYKANDAAIKMSLINIYFVLSVFISHLFAPPRLWGVYVCHKIKSLIF